MDDREYTPRDAAIDAAQDRILSSTVDDLEHALLNDLESDCDVSMVSGETYRDQLVEKVWELVFG